MREESVDNSSGPARPRLARFHNRIAEKSTDRTAAPVLIVALGDSVTQGIGAIDELYHDDVYHAQVKRALEARHPLCTFSVINSGVDGHSAADGARRLDRDVIRHQPDLVIIGFALNDATLGGMAGIVRFTNHLETMIQRIRRETPGEIILLTSNMMLTRDNTAIPERWRHVTQDFLKVQHDDVLAAYATATRELGRKLGVAVADVYAEWQSLAASGVDTTAMLSNGLNHPDTSGHALAAKVVMEVLNSQM